MKYESSVLFECGAEDCDIDRFLKGDYSTRTLLSVIKLLDKKLHQSEKLADQLIEHLTTKTYK